MRTIALIAVLCSFPHFLVASDQDLGAQLTASYAHKGFILLHPMRQNSQKYDAAGKLLSSSEEGPWTLYGPVEITKLQLTPDKLRITGMRLVEVYDSQHRQFVLCRLKPAAKVKIEIELSAPLNTLQDAIAVIRRVFTSNLDDLVPSLPDYWLAYFQRQQQTTSPQTISSRPRSNADGRRTPQKNPELIRIGDKQVKPPKALFTPEPNYPEMAKAARIQGVCVFSATIGVDGRVHDVHIVRPLGAGLDEEGISAMQKWKFRPGTRNGQPVEVQMGLEISFNLYCQLVSGNRRRYSRPFLQG